MSKLRNLKLTNVGVSSTSSTESGTGSIPDPYDYCSIHKFYYHRVEYTKCPKCYPPAKVDCPRCDSEFDDYGMCPKCDARSGSNGSGLNGSVNDFLDGIPKPSTTHCKHCGQIKVWNECPDNYTSAGTGSGSFRLRGSFSSYDNQEVRELVKVPSGVIAIEFASISTHLAVCGYYNPSPNGKFAMKNSGNEYVAYATVPFYSGQSSEIPLSYHAISSYGGRVYWRFVFPKIGSGSGSGNRI